MNSSISLAERRIKIVETGTEAGKLLSTQFAGEETSHQSWKQNSLPVTLSTLFPLPSPE
jgi:hypothetical protein